MFQSLRRLFIWTTLLTLITGPGAAESSGPTINFIGGTTGIPEGTAGYEKWMMYRDRIAELSKGEISVTPMVTGELGSE